MGYVKTADEFADMAERIARDYKTLYVAGCFGAPMTPANKLRYVKNDPYNKAPARQRLIENADSDVFGFDCICLEKAILWDWDGSTDKRYGACMTYADLKASGLKYAAAFPPTLKLLLPNKALRGFQPKGILFSAL